MKYRLLYFPIQGRGELIRLVFHAARVPFTDTRVAFSQWKDLKTKTPSGVLPVLEIDGQMFAGSTAIVQWAARKFGLMGKTDSEELKTLLVLDQVIEARERFIAPFFMEKDPQKIEELKKELAAGLEQQFNQWEKTVVQTESIAKKTFSYLITQSLTVADLAFLYLVDLAKEHVDINWKRFPRLESVLQTVSAVPHLKAYLFNRDQKKAVS